MNNAAANMRFSPVNTLFFPRKRQPAVVRKKRTCNAERPMFGE
jgi:hypothetical protein